MMNRTWVLASASPRRLQLLQEAGWQPDEILSPEVEELHDAALTPEALTIENARLKALAASRLRPGALVLAADTLVYVDDEPLGKPADIAEAVSMLQRLSGRWHQVCTGVALGVAETDSLEVFAVITRVLFKPLSAADIHAYHAVCHPLDKAGGYGIQDGTDLIIDHIEGSFSNVMGLPMEEVNERLKRWFTPDQAPCCDLPPLLPPG